MNTKTFKTIEMPGGIGELRKAGAHLAKVFYSLQVRQTIITGESATDKNEPPAALDIAGEVSISQDEPNQTQVMEGMNSGELLTLHLADGRCLEVYATKGNALTGAYHIVSGNPVGFISE